MGIEKVEESLAILLNGPAKCGKGVVVDYLKSQGYGFKVKSCKDKLHTLTREFFCVPEDRYWEIYNDRTLKEMPLTEFQVKTSPTVPMELERILPDFSFWDPRREYTYLPDGRMASITLSIREALIYMSEVITKPRMGSDYFGVARALSVPDDEIIIDDSTAAFNVNGEIKCDEVVPLIERIGAENTLLIRIHRDGFTFEGDSREYVPDGIVPNTADIYNNGTEQEYYLKVEEVINDFIEHRG